MAVSISSLSSLKPRSERDYLDLLAALFRQHGWKIRNEHSAIEKGFDLAIARGGQRYVVELKAASEGRPDRLVPLLSQAILQVRASAPAYPEAAAPLAVVAAPSISVSAVNSLINFHSQVAPEVAIGILDSQGLRQFVGPGLGSLNAAPPRVQRKKLPQPDSAYLFSDLNQWMLKVLLAPFLSEELLRAPRAEYRNASELAASAGVSVMSAFRLVRQLRQEGFLDQNEEPLRLVRRKELLRRWQAAHLRGAPALPLRWILPSKNKRQLPVALLSYYAQSKGEREPEPRACLGMFGAAESLGFGFVHGAPQYFYLESLDQDVIKRMGLSAEGAEHRADVHVRVPATRESVFRGAVIHEGVPVSDILQVWLDVSSHPARGEEQAEQIRRRALVPILEDNR